MTLKLLREAAMKPAFNAVDEALVERVALAFYTERGFTRKSFDALPNKSHWIESARAVIYPPSPPKTRLEVARELWAAEQKGPHDDPSDVLAGDWDDDPAMLAILAALALPAMEDDQ